MHALVERGQCGVLLKEVLKAAELVWFHALWSRAQQGEMTAVAFDDRSDLAAEVHEVGEDDTHHVEAVGDNAGIGEPAPDHGAVRAGEIDANDPNPLPAFERAQEGEDIGLRAAFDDVEDLVVAQVAEGCGETLAFVKGMLINAQDLWTLKANALGSLAPGELGVDASDGGSTNGSHPGHGGGGDALVMVTVNLLAEGLGTAPTGKQPGELGHEGAPAVPAGKTPGMDDQFGGLAKAVEMTGLAPVAALAAEAAASAARAAHSPAGTGGDMQSKTILVLDSQHPIAVNTNSVKHTGHGGGSPRPMSPFFDQEPKKRDNEAEFNA